MSFSPAVTAVRHRTLLPVLCCLATILYAAYFGAIGVLLPQLRGAFGLVPAVQGTLFPAQFAGFVPGVMLAGYLSDRLGRQGVGEPVPEFLHLQLDRACIVLLLSRHTGVKGGGRFSVYFFDPFSVVTSTLMLSVAFSMMASI